MLRACAVTAPGGSPGGRTADYAKRMRRVSPTPIERALSPIDRALFSIERALFSIERALFRIERPLFRIERAVVGDHARPRVAG